MKISRDLSTINRNQKYFRTRENRNFSTVKSTESRIFNFSVVESGLMVCMAGLQVFIVRFFFQGARKGNVCSYLVLSKTLTSRKRLCVTLSSNPLGIPVSGVAGRCIWSYARDFPLPLNGKEFFAS